MVMVMIVWRWAARAWTAGSEVHCCMGEGSWVRRMVVVWLELDGCRGRGSGENVSVDGWRCGPRGSREK